MKKLLLHLDTDPIASTFDQVVAYDAGVDNIISYSGVTAETVTAQVHGMMFTRGSNKLKNSAIFIGGSNVATCEAVAKAVKNLFFASTRVSVMLDPNGCNTTAAAIARKIAIDHDITGKNVVILGAGLVGQRAALYLLTEGANKVTMTSRRLARAEAITAQMHIDYGVTVIPGESRSDETVAELVNDADIVVASGPAGICLLPKSAWQASSTLTVMADVNAVPPLGIEGLDVMDDNIIKTGVHSYGAIAIGNYKMKLHRAAIDALFDSNDQFLDEVRIYDIAKTITS